MALSLFLLWTRYLIAMLELCYFNMYRIIWCIEITEIKPPFCRRHRQHFDIYIQLIDLSTYRVALVWILFWGPLYQHGFNSIPAWTSNHMPSEVWVEITYPFPNTNGATVEVWEWIINFIPHFKMRCIYLSTLGLNLNHASKRGCRDDFIYHSSSLHRSPGSE